MSHIVVAPFLQVQPIHIVKEQTGTTPCRYKVYDLRFYIHEVMHVILDDSAQICATLTHMPLLKVSFFLMNETLSRGIFA